MLDEIYSVDLKNVRIKSSFGTALKFWGRSLWGNFSVYAKLFLFVAIAFGDPIWMEGFQTEAQQTAESSSERIQRTAGEVFQRIWR